MSDGFRPRWLIVALAVAVVAGVALAVWLYTTAAAG